ncbi:hypothetical protein H0E87_030139, partial [Populus deltoides]
MGNFQLDRVSSFPGDLIPGEQVEQERGRNAQDNLPLSVEDYRIESTIMELNQLVVRGGSPKRLTVNEDEPRGDSSQPTDQVRTPQVNMVGDPWQLVVRDSSRKVLQRNGDESGQVVFLTEELMGREFQNNKNAIWSWIMNDEASSSTG